MVAGERGSRADRGPEGYPASLRLRRRPEITHVYDTGRKVTGRLAVVFFRPSAGPSTRLGVTVTRKAGSAVIRNLLRRRVREIFRRSALVGAATPFEVVVNVSPQGAKASFAELREELERLLARALGRPA
jgi:ribonuclease P protein component